MGHVRPEHLDEVSAHASRSQRHLVLLAEFDQLRYITFVQAVSQSTSQDIYTQFEEWCTVAAAMQQATATFSSAL